MSRFGINVPLIYAKAYACYGLKCVDRAGDPQQRRLARALQRRRAARLHPQRDAAGAGRGAPRARPFRARPGARRAAPMPARPHSGRGRQRAVEPAHERSPGRMTRIGGTGAEILMFNSGGTGARPSLDGLERHGISERRAHHADRGDRAGRAGHRLAQGIAAGLGRRRRAARRPRTDRSRSAPPTAMTSASAPCSTASAIRPGAARAAMRQRQARSASTTARCCAARGCNSFRPAGGWSCNCRAAAATAIPAQRPRADVERDLRNGYISPAQAAADYAASAGKD